MSVVSIFCGECINSTETFYILSDLNVGILGVLVAQEGIEQIRFERRWHYEEEE